MARRWNLIAVGVAFVTGFGAALMPLGTQTSTDSNGAVTTKHISLLSNEGHSVLIIVAVPALLVGVPLLFRSAAASRRSRIAVAFVLGCLVMLGAMSIGLFFVPTLAVMIVSLTAQPPDRGLLP